MIVACQYCLQPALLVHGALVYPKLPTLARKHFWYCAPCKAWVGCHPHSTRPMGGLANAALRLWRTNAHAVFDPMWSALPVYRGKTTAPAMGRGIMTRREAYEWLQKAMNLPEEECHLGMMNEEQCRRVVKLCKKKRGIE